MECILVNNSNNCHIKLFCKYIIFMTFSLILFIDIFQTVPKFFVPSYILDVPKDKNMLNFANINMYIKVRR